MPLLLFSYSFFLSFFFSFFFNDRLEQKVLENYKTDLHQIFRDGRHVRVDVQSGIGFLIGQGTLSWQPILGAKSAKIGNTPFSELAFHNGWQYGKADEHVNSKDALRTSCKNLVNFGPLTPEFTVMVLRPNATNRRNAFDS